MVQSKSNRTPRRPWSKICCVYWNQLTPESGKHKPFEMEIHLLKINQRRSTKTTKHKYWSLDQLQITFFSRRSEIWWKPINCSDQLETAKTLMTSPPQKIKKIKHIKSDNIKICVCKVIPEAELKSERKGVILVEKNAIQSMFMWRDLWALNCCDFRFEMEGGVLLEPFIVFSFIGSVNRLIKKQCVAFFWKMGRDWAHENTQQ